MGQSRTDEGPLLPGQECRRDAWDRVAPQQLVSLFKPEIDPNSQLKVSRAASGLCQRWQVTGVDLPTSRRSISG